MQDFFEKCNTNGNYATALAKDPSKIKEFFRFDLHEFTQEILTQFPESQEDIVAALSTIF